jgi:hypothetical protein
MATFPYRHILLAEFRVSEAVGVQQGLMALHHYRGMPGLIRLFLRKRFNGETPMSHAELILGLLELEVERIDRSASRLTLL